MNLDWFDKNGFIKPRKSWSDSGNGILYLAIWRVLHLEPNPSGPFILEKCFFKPGCLMRTPDNQFGQESWDDYLGVAAENIAYPTIAQLTRYPHKILWFGITHGFFFNTTGSFNWKSFLGRFPQVWSLMWIAAFPWLKWPIFPVLWAIQATFKLDVKDASGFQLEWLFLKSCATLGFTFKNYARARAGLKDAWRPYYDEDHPFQTAEI